MFMGNRGLHTQKIPNVGLWVAINVHFDIKLLALWKHQHPTGLTNNNTKSIASLEEIVETSLAEIRKEL